MALQASGQIKMSEINTELGRSSTAEISLKQAEDGTYVTINTNSASHPDGVAAYEMGEWYSYDHSAAGANAYFRDYANNSGGDMFRDATSPFTSAATMKFSFSLWIRPEWGTSDVNVILFDITPNGATTSNDRLFLIWDYGFNRFVFRHRSSAQNWDKQWPVHSNNGVTGTGTDPVLDRWKGTNKGNVNADGFAHISGYFDGTQATAAAAFGIFWNGSPLTVSNVSNSIGKSSFNKNDIWLGGAYNGASDRDMALDMVSFWDGYKINGTDATTMYNSGAPTTASDAGLGTNLVFETSFEDATPVDSKGNFTATTTNGTRTAY